MLEQMAQDSGGLAAFISRGDNFKRQAKAFRRKLMRPVAADLQIQFDGVRVTDVVPRTLPNLYHGSPIRIYGRYSGKGDAEVSLKANVQGVEMNQSAVLPFPGNDPQNPEIERMWAWKRVDQLLKQADRTGSRQQVLDEIIRLGEGYSIVTEYTSFLVLENDAEYKRWKIERRNSQRVTRDRNAQSAREKELETIRRKATADIGPQPLLAKNQSSPAPVSKQAPKAPAPATQPGASTPTRSQSRDFDFSPGSGPVGPLFLGLAYWLIRRKKKS